MLTEYAISIYIIVGDSDSARGVIEQYRELQAEALEEGADADESAYYLKKAEELLN